MPAQVSVIIPSYNRRQDLCRCIDSVRAQISTFLEIIVVDDCSVDDTIIFLRLNYPDVRLISCAHRNGPSYLRNLGLREARGDFILFLDSDVILPEKDIVHKMVETLSRDKSIGEIGGEIPVYRNITDSALGIRRDFLGRNHNIISRNNAKTENQMKECTYLATCNCMVRKEVAFEVGGFDPYYRFGGEDADFGFRILKKGYSNRVNFAFGVHHHRAISGRYADETLRYHRTRIRFNLKHFSLPRNLLVFMMDFFNFVCFYVALAPKIFIKKHKNIPLVHENYFGGYYLLKAYGVNMPKYAEIKRFRDVNFLDHEEMEKFESSTIHR